MSKLFIPGSRDWDQELIRTVFTPIIADAILQIRPRPGSRSDSLVWRGTKSENFSVKSAYWVLNEERFGEDNLATKKLWKLLLWKIIKDCMKTGEHVGGFFPGNQLRCLLCQQAPKETIDHLFRECPVVKALWFGSRWSFRTELLRCHLWPSLVNTEYHFPRGKMPLIQDLTNEIESRCLEFAPSQKLAIWLLTRRGRGSVWMQVGWKKVERCPLFSSSRLEEESLQQRRS